MEIQSKQDPLTRETFKPARITQRFAHGVNRIRYHNIKAKEDRQIRSVTDKPLLRNYRILKTALGKEPIVRLHREFLNALQYDFTVLTGYDSSSGVAVGIIYDFSIEKEEGNKDYFIIKLINYESHC